MKRNNQFKQRVQNGLLVSVALLLPLASGCLTPPNTDNSHVNATPSSTPTLTPAPGPRAAKIIFRVPTGGSTSGSFDAAPPSGTLPGAGLGHQASRVFNPDGTLLSSAGPGSGTWPRWLTMVEVGVSGSSNTRATNVNCARFVPAGGEAAGTGSCYLGGDSWSCAAPPGYYRVSEYDCLQGAGTADPSDTITDGAGDADDGVYVRAYFSRDAANLDPMENIMAVVEYSASAISAPSEAATCFTGGVFSPETCSDVVWKVFLRGSATAAAVPSYFMLIPPTLGTVTTARQSGSVPVTTRQILLPLATDPTLQVFQLSRIKSRLTKNDNLLDACHDSNNGTPGNSPHCAGVVLYSITFYRI